MDSMNIREMVKQAQQMQERLQQELSSQDARQRWRVDDPEVVDSDDPADRTVRFIVVNFRRQLQGAADRVVEITERAHERAGVGAGNPQPPPLPAQAVCARMAPR